MKSSVLPPTTRLVPASLCVLAVHFDTFGGFALMRKLFITTAVPLVIRTAVSQVISAVKVALATVPPCRNSISSGLIDEPAGMSMANAGSVSANAPSPFPTTSARRPRLT